VIDLLEMAEDKKAWMRYRWMDQVRWFDTRAAQLNRRHNWLRVVAITGGVLVPGLVSVSSGGRIPWLRDSAGPLAFTVSLLVAVAVGLDGFFHFGERWRHYRRTAELLRIEGWLFIEGAGRYKEHQHRDHFHDRFFPVFATKVEDLIRRDVEVFLTQIVQERADDPEEEKKELSQYLEKVNDPASPKGASRSSSSIHGSPGGASTVQ
jgi:hypothetical protein